MIMEITIEVKLLSFLLRGRSGSCMRVAKDQPSAAYIPPRYAFLTLSSLAMSLAFPDMTATPFSRT